jgi:hypothetical protein
MASLHIGSTSRGKCTLPDNAATQALAFLGRRGSGKTYAATKLAELMYGVGSQFVAIDPVGVWWGLRNSPDGKGQGLKDVVIFGGLHADVPLQPGAGELVADVIVDRGISAVLDVSQFEADTDKARFAKDFAARFFYLKKASPSPVHIFIEEAQEFIPQNTQKGEEQMLHVWQRMIRLGRNFGIGVTMISQRPQDVNKKALNQAECVFAFQLTGLHERKAVKDWISDKGLDENLIESLPSLPPGHAHVWSPEWLKINEVVSIGAKTTYAAGTTPTSSSKAIETKPLAAADFEKLTASMTTVIEASKANDPRELKKKIAELEKQVKSVGLNPSSKQIELAVDLAVKKRDFHHQSVIKIYKKGFDELQSIAIKAHKTLSEVLALALPAIDSPSTATTALVGDQAKKYEYAKLSDREPRIQKLLAQRPNGTGSGETMPKAERKILIVLAQRHPSTTGKKQLAVIAEYKHSGGGFNNALGALRNKQYIVGSDPIEITDEGLTALGEYEALPTGLDLVRHWQSQFPKAEKTILDVLIDHYPKALTKTELAEESGYESSGGGFNNALGRLRTYELIDGSKEIKLKDTLFG